MNADNEHDSYLDSPINRAFIATFCAENSEKSKDYVYTTEFLNRLTNWLFVDTAFGNSEGDTRYLFNAARSEDLYENEKYCNQTEKRIKTSHFKVTQLEILISQNQENFQKLQGKVEQILINMQENPQSSKQYLQLSISAKVTDVKDRRGTKRHYDECNVSGQGCPRRKRQRM